jgi:hypothetical protein
MERELGEGIPLKRWNEKGFSFQRKVGEALDGFLLHLGGFRSLPVFQ